VKTKRKKHSLSRKRLLGVVVDEFHAKSQVASSIPSYNKPTQRNIYPWVLSAPKETYILGCCYISLGVIGTQGNGYPWVLLHFLDGVKNLTTDLFP